MSSTSMLKLLLLALAALCWIRPPQVMAQPQGGNVRVLEHVSYGIEAPQAQVLNAYLAQEKAPTEAIIQIVSGSWNSAPPQRASVQPFQAYLDAGISVIVAAHRPMAKTSTGQSPVTISRGRSSSCGRTRASGASTRTGSR
jgi:hypothetical protein